MKTFQFVVAALMAVSSLAFFAPAAIRVQSPRAVRPTGVSPLRMCEPSGTSTLEKVQEVVVEQLGVDKEEVVPQANFIDDLGADSLDTVELIMALEETFETEIPEETATTLVTVKDVVEFIEKH
ncbi:unnamed protein product [Discosporangium mesarthrocarpum]